MPEEKKEIVIGIRGDAKQARTACILFFVMAGIAISNGIFWWRQLAGIDETDNIIGLVMFLVLLAAAIVLVVASIFSLVYVSNNSRFGHKPVLVYNPEEDTFIGYDCRHGNRRVTIKNGSIIKVKGNAMWTARELFVYYKKKDKIRKVSLGFCRNIDNYVFKDKLNEYHNPKI